MDVLINIGRGALGVVVLLAICWLISNNRKAINWRLVLSGLALQLILAVLVLQVPFIRQGFDFVSSFFVVVLQFTEAGTEFVLGKWPVTTNVVESIGEDGQPKLFTVGYIFAFKVLPTIIFFSALSSLLYYLGVLQFIIKGFAWVMTRTMRLTGAESLATAANIFIGQTEAPLVVKPYLEGMSRSEILCLMTGGMATIAGGVFAAYVGFLGGNDPVELQKFATHLLTASIMSAPAAIIAAKIIYPETDSEKLKDKTLDVPKEQLGDNALDAIAHGTTDGLKLAVNVGAMLLVFTAFVAMFNYMLVNFVGSWTGLNDWVVDYTDGRFKGFNIEFLLGMCFSPIAWLIGVPSQDVMQVGQLLGLKTTLNEFFAYASLEGMKASMSERSVLLATYALCGFSNFASIGIQVGGISALAPGQRKNLSELGVKALIGGTVACLMTAAIAGMIIR